MKSRMIDCSSNSEQAFGMGDDRLLLSSSAASTASAAYLQNATAQKETPEIPTSSIEEYCTSSPKSALASPGCMEPPITDTCDESELLKEADLCE